MDPDQRDKFFDIFLSDKYADKDRLYPDVVAFVKKTVDRMGLPVVIITRRPERMKHTRDVAVSTLEQNGISVHRLIQRREDEIRLRSVPYKLGKLKLYKYRPRVAFDDDERILKALSERFPEAELYKITDGSVVQYTPEPAK